MEASKVYYTSLKPAAQKICCRSCVTLYYSWNENIDFEDKYAAIKIHFGVRKSCISASNYAKVVVDLVKNVEEKHFLRIAIPFM